MIHLPLCLGEPLSLGWRSYAVSHNSPLLSNRATRGSLSPFRVMRRKLLSGRRIQPFQRHEQPVGTLVARAFGACTIRDAAATITLCGREKGTGTFCAKHPPGRSGKRCLSPFPVPDFGAERSFLSMSGSAPDKLNTEFLGIRCRLIELAARWIGSTARKTPRPTTRDWRRFAAVSKSSPPTAPIAPSRCRWCFRCLLRRD